MWYENLGFLCGAATAVGLVLAVMWWLLLLGEWVARLVWKWVDDADELIDSKIAHLIMVKWMKYEPEKPGCGYLYSRDNDSYSDGVFQVLFLPPLLLFFSSWLIVLMYWFTWFFAALAVLALVIFISRALRRLIKRFNAHEKDPGAHK